MKAIARGWDSYRTTVVPIHASKVQVNETRQAFYAGAAILYETIMRMLDPGEDATEADMQRMVDLQMELDEFFQNQSKGQ